MGAAKSDDIQVISNTYTMRWTDQNSTLNSRLLGIPVLC